MVRRGLTGHVVSVACLALILLTAGPHRAAADTPESGNGNRVVAVFFSVDPPADGPDQRTEEARLLSSGLVTSLAANLDGYSFVLLQTTPTDRRDQAAVAAGADAWIGVNLRWGNTAIDVRVAVKDLYYEDPGAVLEYEIPAGGAFRGNTGRYWYQAVDLVESRLLSPEYETFLVVTGAPGTVITGLGGEALVLDDNGERGIYLPFGETFSYRADAKRYHTVEGDLRTSSPEARLFLSQPPRGRFGYEAFLTGFSYPGAGVSFHVVPAWSMLRVDLFTYAFGLIPYADVGGEEGSLFASDPVSHLTAWFLQHLVPPGRRFRPYIGVGGSARMLHTGGTIRTEPVAPYGATAVLGLEAPRRYGAWFFEYAPLFYFVEEPELWDDQFSSGQSGYLRIGENALDLLMVRFGFRVTPPGWRR